MNQEVQEAMERARRHLRLAMREGLEASRALVDAALLAAPIDDASRAGLAGEVRRALDACITALDGDHPFRMPAAFVEPLEQALQAEIDRWEKRSASDESARPVLRAFLGLRELLWELGMRSVPKDEETPAGPEPSGSAPPTSSSKNPDARSATSDAAPRPPKKSRPRVQRFDLGER